MTRFLRLMAFAGLGVLVACSGGATSPEPTRDARASMRWDHRPEADRWTAAALDALDSHAAALVQITPADIDTYCPAYARAPDGQRALFWVGLMSALAKHESTWRPDAVGGDGRWHGLLQISPATARGYGCEATTGAALRDGPANLSCAARIWATTVPRDGVISDGRGGVAADWGPFSVASKRQDIARWTRAQPYCQPADR